MPTRQTAISEILNLIAAHDQALKSQLLDLQHTYYVDHTAGEKHEPYLVQAVPIEAINTVYKENK